MLKIIFVCHGNICRSPMAEFIMKKLISDEGLSDRIFVASCATSGEEIFCGRGNPVYPPANAELLKHGITCEGKRAVRLTAADAEKYDLFIGMDSENIYNMLKILGKAAAPKIKKLPEFAGSKADIADPWYYGNFERTYNEIETGCKGLLEYLKASENL